MTFRSALAALTLIAVLGFAASLPLAPAALAGDETSTGGDGTGGGSGTTTSGGDDGTGGGAGGK